MKLVMNRLAKDETRAARDKIVLLIAGDRSLSTPDCMDFREVFLKGGTRCVCVCFWAWVCVWVCVLGSGCALDTIVLRIPGDRS